MSAKASKWTGTPVASFCKQFIKHNNSKIMDIPRAQRFDVVKAAWKKLSPIEQQKFTTNPLKGLDLYVEGKGTAKVVTDL